MRFSLFLHSFSLDSRFLPFVSSVDFLDLKIIFCVKSAEASDASEINRIYLFKKFFNLKKSIFKKSFAPNIYNFFNACGVYFTEID